MKQKIISKATDLFLRLGFKSVTMDDIANEMCISKKTIYKYFINKEVLIAESTRTVNEEVRRVFEEVQALGINAIAQHFEIRRRFRGIFDAAETSPIYQLKKHYPEIYDAVVTCEFEECRNYLVQNINKGIGEDLYRADIPVETYANLHHTTIFAIKSNTRSEAQARELELQALEYHIRAMATEKGLAELEKQLNS
jgi:AcrR family transcriptional regulator